MYLQIPHPLRPIKPEPDGDEVRAPERRAKTSLAKLIANACRRKKDPRPGPVSFAKPDLCPEPVSSAKPDLCPEPVSSAKPGPSSEQNAAELQPQKGQVSTKDGHYTYTVKEEFKYIKTVGRHSVKYINMTDAIYRRHEYVNRLVAVANHLRLDDTILHLAVQIVDEYMTGNGRDFSLQLLFITGLYVASKTLLQSSISIADFAKLTDGKCTGENMSELEQVLTQNVLPFVLQIPNGLHFQFEGLDLIARNTETEDFVNYMLGLSLHYYSVLHHEHKVKTAAALYLANEVCGRWQIDGDTCMNSLVRHLACDRWDVVNCVIDFVKLLRDAERDAQRGEALCITEHYWKVQQDKASKMSDMLTILESVVATLKNGTLIKSEPNDAQVEPC